MVFRIKCKWCGDLITFDGAQRSKNGKSIPLNLDGTFHECPAKPEVAPRVAKSETEDGESKLDSILASLDNLTKHVEQLEMNLDVATNQKCAEGSNEAKRTNGKQGRKAPVTT